MPRNVYRGRRIQVTFPNALFEKIEKISEKDTTSLSQTIMQLCLEAIQNRESAGLGNDTQ
jgi:metal-responsive CopG/Arc/MetJ family transcriptional regulator